MGALAAIGAAAAVASAGVGIAGAMSGGGKAAGGSSTQQTSNVPWSAQQPFLQSGLQNAQDIYGQRGQTPFSSYYAAMNPQQMDATNSIYNQGINSGADDKFGMLANAGRSGLGGSDSFLNNASTVANDGIGARDPTMSNLLSSYAQTGSLPGQTGVDPRLAGTVTGAAQQGLGSLAQGQGIAGQVAGRAMDPNAAMGATVNGANQYINNSVLQGQIDAVGTDISRNLGETTLPGIRQAAAASGNVNSSREGALEAIAGRGANENLANAAANLRGTAYNTGAQLASSQFQNGNNTALGAAGALNTNGATAGTLATNQMGLQQQQGQFGTTSQLASANSVANQNLGWQTADTAAQLAANGQIGTGVQMGAQNLSSGLNGPMAQTILAQQAGGYNQQQQQAALTSQDQRSQQLLNDYWGIVGKPLGTEGSSASQTAGPGFLGGALGGLTTGVGLAKNLTGNDLVQNAAWNLDNGAYGTTGGAGTQTLQNLGFFNPLT